MIPTESDVEYTNQNEIILQLIWDIANAPVCDLHSDPIIIRIICLLPVHLFNSVVHKFFQVLNLSLAFYLKVKARSNF